MLNNNE
jgi:hypothetical protein